MKADVIVIGAGPAGLMAAGICAAGGLSTVVLDKNRLTGRKLRLTGKGRCNVTNHTDIDTVIAETVRNGKFLYAALNGLPPKALMDFFQQRGVPLKTERGNRVFPVSDRAEDIASALQAYAVGSGAKLQMETQVQQIEREEAGGFSLRVRGEKTGPHTYRCDRLLLACGGASYPGTGSNGDGARFARRLGHRIETLQPSLVPLIEDGDWCRQMQGLSLKNCAVKVKQKATGKTVYTDFGELLFTHFGLSGPLILSASAHMRDMEQNAYQVWIDLKPALCEQTLDQRLQRDFTQNHNRFFMNSLDALLPRKMIPALVARSGIDPKTRCNEITRQQRIRLGRLLKAFAIDIKGFRPISEAIITAGGVSVKEVDPKTMQSKLVKGLYFAGEILDLDAYTGGFNLQIAFSTGFLAGTSMVNSGFCGIGAQRG